MTARPGDADNFNYDDPPPVVDTPVKTEEYEDKTASTSSTSTDTSTTDTTTDTTTGSDDEGLILPGNPKLWYNEDTDEYWVVYVVPEITLPDGTTSGPFYSSWLVPDDADLTALVGPGKKANPDFTGGTDDFTDKGVMDMGEVDELRDFTNIEGDPFDTWVEDMSVLAKVRPWILDEDYIKLVIQAAMERADGQVSLEEIKGTKWWVDNTPAQRAWLETWFGDPAAAEQMLADNRLNVRTQLESAGIANPSQELIDYIADRTTMGDWSMAMLQSQINALADSYSSDVLNDDLVAFMVDNNIEVDGTRNEEDTVRNLLNEWLGPVYGAWSEQDIAKKAGELRNDPDAEIAFTEYLKDQRMAMYPGYQNREISYAAAARPWATFLAGAWGTVPDETDEVFQDVMQKNDPTYAGKTARKVGFNRGYEKVVNEVVSGISTGSRSNVIGAT